MSLEIVEPSGGEFAVGDWEGIYKQQRTKFYDFTREVHEIIKKNIDAIGINVSLIEARTKSVESFCEKIARDGKSYASPIEDMTDLSGCRIITYYNDELDAVEEMIRTVFFVDEKNSQRKDAIENPKEFGYLSRHFVVALSADRLKLGEYKRFAGMKAEIQVRSVLQHAWAAIEHKLQYKRSEDIPKPLRRKLFQVSALLEMADDQFSYIKKKVATLRQEYRADLVSGGIEVPINIESLDVFLEESTVFSRIKEMMPTDKFVLSPRPPGATNTLSKLNAAIRVSKIRDLSDFRIKMESVEEKEWTEFLARLFESWRQQVPLKMSALGPIGPKRLVLDDSAIARLVILFLAGEPSRRKLVKEVPFGDKLQIALKNLVGLDSDI